LRSYELINNPLNISEKVFSFIQVEAGLCFIEKNPLAFPEKYVGTRQYLIKRFPYKIIYRVEDSKVIVLGIIYGGRDPKWIRKRINGFN
jgi:mRNA-degrading endonuclease RelE of RelBE toxin-antitoxin system